MRKFIPVLLLLILGTAISAQNVHISGSILNRKYSNEVIVMKAYSQERITSVPLQADNTFVVDFTLDKPEYIYLGPDEYNLVLLIASPGETIAVVADVDDITRPVITGSELTAKMYRMMDQNDVFSAKSDSIYRMADSLNFAVEKQRSEYYRNIFQNEKPTLASLVFLDMLDPVNDSVLFRNVVEELHKEFPDNAFVNDYMDELNKTPVAFTKGSIPPDILLNGPDDKPLALSSLKGKIVLVDFWASWCKPCLTEIPNLSDLYKTYHKKGFEIYSVSLDRDKQAWTDAIDRFDMNWHHVSDLKYWESQAAIDWHVESIPATFLLDRNGVIIEKDLRGEQLKTVLEELFK